MDKRIGFRLYQSCGNSGSVECVLCFGCGGVGGVGGVGGEWAGAWIMVWIGVGWCYICASCESGFIRIYYVATE